MGSRGHLGLENEENMGIAILTLFSALPTH